MSNIAQLTSLRDSMKPLSNKLIYNMESNEDILPLIMLFEQYQKSTIELILSAKKSDLLPTLKDILAKIQQSLENKDWVLLNHIIYNDLGQLETKVAQ